VDETRNYVTILNAVVVMGAVDIGGDNGSEVAAVFLLVAAAENIRSAQKKVASAALAK
jgi:hypothetical protein